MIVKMKKYAFLVYHGDYDKFLSDLQELGVVHIVERNGEAAEEIKLKINLIKRLDTAIKHLKTRLPAHKISKEIKPGTDCIELLDRYDKLYLDIDQRHQKLHQLNKELNGQTPWGDFSIELVRKIEQEGVAIKFFTAGKKSFSEEWKDKYRLEIVSETTGNINFAVFFRPGESVDIKADEIKLFDRSVSDIKQEIKAVKDRIAEDKKSLDSIAEVYLRTFEDFRVKTENDKQFRKIKEQGKSAAGDKMLILEGWIPETKAKDAREYLERNGTLYLETDPPAEELSAVPILMQNNAYAKMFEPIGKLFSLPAYSEIDLTPFFAPFFMLFFGFCLGDAGYGIVLILTGTILKFKLNKEFKPMLTLVQLLGLMTVIMGAVGGTFFGINLIETDLKFKDMFLNSNSMFWLALGLGVVQILFGMCIKAANKIRNDGWMYAISTFGWMLMVLSLVGMSLKPVFAYLKMAPEAIEKMTYLTTIASVSGKTVLIGVAMILFFNDPKANIFIRILKGMWQLYDITGLFGDVLSYIRLFALGVSGAILGLVINNIAAVFLEIPYIGWLIFVVFLVIGHTGNILLSGLGSLVHPMRLTFVEFYKNAGWTGGGKEYKPFKRSI
jgi:V/A-type H+/Na+-transporting ATPase subunit I